MKLFSLLLTVSVSSVSALSFAYAYTGQNITAEQFIHSDHTEEVASGCSFIDPRGCGS